MNFNVVTFFEKKGCSTNAKQKEMLRDLGITLQEVDLLQYPFTKQELQSFFATLPVDEWFNPNAPQIKNQKLNPKSIDAATALDLLLKEPILIRRPLLMVRGKRMVGFDKKAIFECLDMDYIASDEDYERCSHT